MGRSFFVVTGGPGSGKTSLVAALADGGIRTTAEAGRAIIRDEVRTGGSSLPWADCAGFAARMLAWDLRSYRAAAGHAPVVFDRGIPDVIGYLALSGLDVPRAAQEAAERFRYNPEVFVAPFWPDIYRQDDERRQTAVEAETTCRVMVETYRALGYTPVMLPRAGIDERVDFVRRHVATDGRA